MEEFSPSKSEIQQSRRSTSWHQKKPSQQFSEQLQNSPSKINLKNLSKKYLEDVEDLALNPSTIADLGNLSFKYILKCIQGLYKGRFLFVTMHVKYYFTLPGRRGNFWLRGFYFIQSHNLQLVWIGTRGVGGRGF